MTIYFTASLEGKKRCRENYEVILQYLKEQGCEVIAKHIMDTSSKIIDTESKEERLNFQSNLKEWICQSEAVVVEASFPSISVGYEISLALQAQKPTLILYTKTKPPSLLAHHHDERLICEHYTKESLQCTLTDFLRFVKGNQDARFTFFITPQIASFLESMSKIHKVPKSVYVRHLIQKEMKNGKKDTSP